MSNLAERNAAILAAVLDDRKTYTEVGKQFGLTRQSIYLIVRKMYWGELPKREPKGRTAKMVKCHVCGADYPERQYRAHRVAAGHPARPLRNLDYQRDREIVAALKSGLTWSEVAEKFGVCSGTVTNARIRQGEWGVREYAKNNERRLAVYRRYEAGEPIPSIAKAFGVYPRTISRDLKIVRLYGLDRVEAEQAD